MKGFGAIVLIMAVFAAGIIMMTASAPIKMAETNNEIFTESAAFASNYEIVLNNAAQDCNWTTADVNNCIDSNSTTLLGLMPKENISCTKSPLIKSGAEYYFELTCENALSSTKGTLAKVQFIRKLYVRQG
ncbi:MAG: hypothetical protein AABW59_04155 [archaeon]